MFLGLFFALLVAFFWSVGEISYSRLAKSLDRANVYLYQYLARSVIYLTVVLIFNISQFTSFNLDHFKVFLPVIICDWLGSYVVNIAMSNGKLSVVSPIMAAYPIIDIMLGLILLKEKIGIVEISLSIIIAISIIYLATIQKKSKKAPHPLKGIIFAVIYMLFVAFSVFFEKSAYVDNYPVYELYYYKGLIYLATSVMFMSIIGITPVKLKKPNKEILMGSGITPIGNVINSFALQFGNMIVVTPISSMYSIITNFLSRFVLKEKISIKERICIAIILLCTIALIVCGII